jgi:hypothetical protein
VVEVVGFKADEDEDAAEAETDTLDPIAQSNGGNYPLKTRKR